MKRKYVRKNRFARQDASQQPLKTQQNQYEVFPGAVFDKDIFQFLSKDSGNLNTEGRRQYYHSITLFPLDTKEKKIDMTSYLYNPAKPFQYYGGERDDKIIGLIPDLNKNDAKIKEGAGGDLWSTNENVGKDAGLTKRDFGHHTETLFVKKPDQDQDNESFSTEEMKDYEIKNKIIDLARKKNNHNGIVKHYKEINALKKRLKSPTKIIETKKNGHTEQIHLVNEAVYNQMISDGKTHEQAMKASQRVSYDVPTGKTWQQYNEYIVETPFETRPGKHHRRKSLETIGMFIDTRKPVELSRQDKENLKEDIKNFIEKKQKRMNNFPVFKIGADNKMTKLNSLKEINQVISTFPDR